MTDQVDDVPDSLLVAADDLPSPPDAVRWAISFDGSHQEVAVREQYPSTRIGYIQVAAVLVHLEEMLGQGDRQLVDPRVIRDSAGESLYSLVMPSANVCRSDSDSVKESWRRELNHLFTSYSIENSSLAEVFMTLVQFSDKRTSSGRVLIARCPGSNCSANEIEVGREGTACPACGIQVFPTDALRIHEEVAEEHSNLTALGRLMSLLEHISMAGYLLYLLDRQPNSLSSVAFLMDGPLAIFGPQAWLHTALQNLIADVAKSLVQQGMRLPVIVGLEKTGQFSEHAGALRDRIPPRTLVRLPDSYIYDHILANRPAQSGAFGRDTYYGRKFFYRTAQGQLLTITSPQLADSSEDDPVDYPMLPATLKLLDQVGTALYEDAVIPVALAHSYASIPLHTGSRVLTLLSRQHLADADE